MRIYYDIQLNDRTIARRELEGEAIVKAGKAQPAGRRMGTTAVLALQSANQVYVAGLGDSRAYLIRDGKVALHAPVSELDAKRLPLSLRGLTALADLTTVPPASPAAPSGPES